MPHSAAGTISVGESGSSARSCAKVPTSTVSTHTTSGASPAQRPAPMSMKCRTTAAATASGSCSSPTARAPMPKSPDPAGGSQDAPAAPAVQDGTAGTNAAANAIRNPNTAVAIMMTSPVWRVLEDRLCSSPLDPLPSLRVDDAEP
jgi:hypothetical protein